MARSKPSAILDFRILFLAGLFLVALTAVGIRLWWVQIRLYSTYKSRIQGSSEVTVRIPSVRGEIRDRNGVALVTNRPSYEVDFYLPDLVTGYKKQYGQPPTLDYRARDSEGMLHDRKVEDIVQIVDKTITRNAYALIIEIILWSPSPIARIWTLRLSRNLRRKILGYPECK